MNQTLKGYLYVFIYTLLISISSVVIKSIDHDLPSTLLVFTRHLIGGILLLLIIISQNKLKQQLLNLSLKQWCGLILLGVISSGLASFMYVIAIRKIGVGLTALLTSLELPIGIYFGMLVLKEKITIKYLKIAGVILIGFLLLIVKSGIEINLANNFVIGVLLALGTALLWGVSTILGKLFLNKEISPVVVTCVRGLTGASFSLGLSLLVLPSVITPFFNLEKLDWLKISYLGIGVSALGLLFYYQALKRLEIKKISLVYALQPVIATSLGIATGEVMLLSQWVGGVLVIMGIISLLKLKE